VTGSPAPSGMHDHGLSGGGEMGRRVRTMDWSKTPLGPIERWPVSLRARVGMILEMRFPTIIGWGDELTAIYNDSYEELRLGHPDALGRPLREVWPEGGELLSPIVERALTGEALSFENFPFVVQRAGRSERAYFDLCVSPLRDEGGAVVGFLAIGIETTARVRHTSHMAEIFERVAVGLSELSLDGSFLYVNEALCRILGRSRAEILRSSFVDVTHPEDVQHSLDAVRQLVERGDPVALDKRYLRPDGSVVFANSSLTRIDDEQGRPQSVMAVTVDLTDHKQAAEATRRAAERDAFRVALSDALRPLASAIEVQKAAARVLGEYLGVNRAMYVERLGDGDRVLIQYDYCVGVPTLAGRHRLSDYGPILEGLMAGRTVVVSDVARAPEFTAQQRDAFASVGVGAYVAVPVVKGGRMAAFFNVHQSEPRVFSADEIDLIEETAERCWDAVQRAQAEEALRENDRRKDEFLATLAHELRNPLAPLRNGLEILRLSGVEDRDPRVEKIRAMMVRQVDTLSRLVDDLLEVSRITRGAIELRKARVDVSHVVRDALETNASLIERAGQDAIVSLPGEPLLVEVDPMRLAQVFGNLLNNAARYTRGKGEIYVAARRDGSEVVVSVRDTGIGIAKDVLPRIFDMFAQGDSASRGQGGLGIGLTLARSIVGMHGGSIEARSEGVGRGAEFIVRLPGAPKPSERMAPAEGMAATPTLACRVLVVDDNRDAADTTGALLEMLGAEVRVVYDGPSALAQVADFSPAVVLLDLGLPGMDGFEIAHQLRQHPQGRHAKLIALTGWGQEEDRRRTREAGFHHHLVKPPDVRALQAVLAESGVTPKEPARPGHAP
jgi:PAS domain S-box-containing protein